MDDILLSSSDLGLLGETKEYLFKTFHMVDMGEETMLLASRSLGIDLEEC